MSMAISKMSNTGMLYETETQRLQKGLDDFTKMLEKEKKYFYEQALPIPGDLVQWSVLKANENERETKRETAKYSKTKEECRSIESLGK